MNKADFKDWKVERHSNRDIAFMFGVDVEQESTNQLRLTCTYIESPEAVNRKEFKQIEFWIYKEEAAKLGSILTRLASSNGAIDHLPEPCETTIQ